MKVLATAFMMALLFSACASTVYFGKVHAATMWSQIYEDHFNDRVDYLIQTSDGGYAIAGNHYISGEEKASSEVPK